MNKVVGLLLIMISMVVIANDAVEVNHAIKYKNQLTELNELGIELHLLMTDPDDIEQRKQCAVRSHPARDQTQLIEKQINDSYELGSNQIDLVVAAGQVFSCLYCNPSSAPACIKAKQTLRDM
ncbi:MAG: hypothetical protein COA63_010765 [Methylophaga sp.]|nr:hypothetical protein [Methylophaga sp.]